MFLCVENPPDLWRAPPGITTLCVYRCFLDTLDLKCFEHLQVLILAHVCSRRILFPPGIQTLVISNVTTRIDRADTAAFVITHGLTNFFASE